MRNRLFLSLIAAAGVFAASAAQAGTLTTATWTQTLQGVSLTVTNSGSTCTSTGPNLVQQEITCSTGSGLAPTGTSTGTSYNVALTLPAFGINQFTTGGAININTKAAIGGSQVINGGNVGAATVNQGIAGMVTVKVAAHVGKGVNASLLAAGATTLVLVPLSAGVADTFTGFFYVLGSAHYITVDFYAWTVGTQTFTGLTTKGVPLPNVTAKGNFGLDSMGGGTVTVVSPSKISIDGPLAQRRTASFTTLKLTYAATAPEPSTLLLLGAGVVGLALVGSRKRS
jgi:hypothetical protein